MKYKLMDKDVSSTECDLIKIDNFTVNMAIPNNAVVHVNKPGLIKEFFVESVEVTIGIGKDHTASLIMDIEAFAALKKGEPVHFTC